MGDLVEFSTPRKHQNLFYKVTNNALIFYVKGVANATVGLARTPDDCVHWVVIGNEVCYIISEGNRYQLTSSKNVLSGSKYKMFWISWNNGNVKLGKGNKPSPIFSHKILETDLNFVTFSSFKENDLHWKCYLPPQKISLKPAMKKIKGGKPHWVKFHKKLPEDAIIGGYEKEVLYIMRAMHETALTPGKFVPSTGKGYVEWGWHVHEKSEFEIFCGYDCIWVPSSGNNIPVGAIEAGYTEGVHEIMYIGRVMYDNHVIPGKIAPSHNVCYIAFDGRSLAIEEYEILVYPFQRNKSVNEFYVSNLHIPEFSTPQKHQNLFYRVTNKAVIFYVKGEANASVGLARTPTTDDCLYWVVIGNEMCSIIRKGRNIYKLSISENLLFRSEYKMFWISWNNGNVKLGKGNKSSPIFSHKILETDLNFVTFSSFNDSNLLWKCYLPPQNIYLKPVVKKVKGGRPRWVKFDNKLPEDSIVGGYENEVLYIMRAMHEAALTPGKFVPSTGKGYVAWGVNAHEKSECEIFCGYDCIWFPSSGNNIPVGAIEAGYTEIVHEIMYIGRSIYKGHVIPGKIEPSHGVCYIAYDGKTVAIKEYEILIDPFQSNKSVNDFYVSDLRTPRSIRQIVYEY